MYSFDYELLHAHVKGHLIEYYSDKIESVQCIHNSRTQIPLNKETQWDV